MKIGTYPILSLPSQRKKMSQIKPHTYLQMSAEEQNKELGRIKIFVTNY